MSCIEDLITDVNKTHAGLGELIAVLRIATKARKFVLIVAPSGCGKSRAMEFISKNTKDSWSPTSMSIASLVNKVDKLEGFRSVICIDDIATIQTIYARTATITALSALCYSHRVEPSMVGFDFCIEDFYGAAMVGIQPILLRDLMLSPEWDASIQDKALRYYHLTRPLSPALYLPNIKYEQGLDIEKVKDFEPDISSSDWLKLINLADSQWSRARAKEHMRDMLKGVAVLENRVTVLPEDYALLARLLKPMAIENLVVTKNQLEGERLLDNNLLALLAEYYTYGKEFPLAQIALDYKLSLSQCYRIMQEQNGNWQQISKSPTIYSPSKRFLSLLKQFSLEVK